MISAVEVVKTLGKGGGGRKKEAFIVNQEQCVSSIEELRSALKEKNGWE